MTTACFPGDAVTPLPIQQYTIDESAQILKMHPSTVRRLIRTGELKVISRSKLLRIAHRDLEDYQARNRH
jgi:excisionase family DNA binding protein